MDAKQHIFVGLSGGVDSSVAALLLLKQGYRVTGVFMKNWSDCDWITEERWAKKAAAHLKIPFASWDFEKEYREKVLTNFFSEYQEGRTPNPDILCNKYIKFDLFLKRALEAGADGIATGHYAVAKRGSLYRATDTQKDQTYFLYALTKDQLRHVRFPLGTYTKQEVRAIAKASGLPNFAKKDSQGICFVGAVDVKSFLESKLPKKKGYIIDPEGERIGEHDGIHFYTEGQREGLNLGGLSEPYYIAYKDSKENVLIASPKSNPLLYTNSIVITDVIIQAGGIADKAYTVKVRYRQPDQEARIETMDEGRYRIRFSAPQWAVAAGQSAVIYDKDMIVGGGVIESVERDEALVETIKMKFNSTHAISRN